MKTKNINALVTRTANTYTRYRSAAMMVDPSKESNMVVRDHPNIPLGTTYEGVLIGLPSLGEPIVMGYHKKDGVSVHGLEHALITTKIIKIEGDDYHTANSVYNIKQLPDEN